MQFTNLLATRLTQLRLDHTISQKLLSTALGISPQTLNDIEKGRTNATLDRAISMAQFFNVSLDYLVGLSEDSTISQSPAWTNDPILLLPADEQDLLLSYRELTESDHKSISKLIKLMEDVSKSYNFRYNLNQK